MKLTNDYILDFKTRFTYNSNKIDKSTVSLPETVALIKDDYSPEGKSVRELYEIVNHSEAVDFILAYDGKVDINFIKALHKILMNSITPSKGIFKGLDPKTSESNFEIEAEMHQYFGNLNYQLNQQELFEVLALAHIKYQRIAPFAEGNGKIGRLLMNKLLLNNNRAPVIISADNNQKYYHLLLNKDTEGLKKYLEELSILEKRRIISFAKMEEQKILNKELSHLI